MGLLSTIGAASGRAFGLTRVGAAIRDAYFNLTTLLLPGNGTNGAQNNTFTDSSSNGFGITRNPSTGPNAPTQGTFSPFSQTGWSNYFDGNGDFLNFASSASFGYGTGDYTIEGWVWSTTRSVANTFFANGTDNCNLYIKSSTGIIGLYTGSVNDSTTALPLNQWNHIAVVRNGSGSNNTQVYLNGTSILTITNTTNFSNTTFFIGRNGAAGSEYMNGYISNVRVTKGRAVYTSSFTPPTSPLGKTSGGQNPPQGTECTLLTCQSNRFVDNSDAALTVTPNADSSVQAFSPFAPTAAYSAATVGGSGYFDGTGDSLASTTDFEASTSTSTFTIEGFIYPTTFSTLINIIGGMVVSSGDQKSIAAEVNTSGQVALYWFDGAIKRCTGNTVMQLNAWNYFAIVVNSNAISIYVNKTTADTLSGTTTLTNRTQLTTLGVGAYYNNNAPAQYFNGYLSNIRVSTVARTISAVPTAPLTSDANVRWLFNFTNAGITDATAKNVLETVGNAQISTTQSKFGGSSISFDGTGDNLVIPSSPNVWFGSGAFSIEMWLYPNNASSEQMLLCGNDTGSLFLGMNIDGANRIALGRKGVAVDNFVSYTYSTGAWIYLAVTRDSSNNIKFFVNGSQVGSTGTNANSFTNSVMNIGFEPTQKYLNGYIDDLRITKGIARTITASPTAAFPLQ